MMADEICVMCREPLEQSAWLTLNLGQSAHQACQLRTVLGGIGHLLAHEHWCVDRGDPDAGLTYYQSSVLVATLTNMIGVEAVVEMGTEPL